MKVAVRRTGLTSHVIRVWERRYQAVEPERTATNRRLYSEADIDHLCMLHQAIRQGHQIGQLAHLSLSELADLVHSDPGSPPDITTLTQLSTSGADDVAGCLERCLEAASRLDAGSLEEHLALAAVALSRRHLLLDLIPPLLHRVGEGWEKGALRITHEHLISVVVRNFLGALRPSALIAPTAPTIIFTTPAGQLHELGALLAAAMAAEEGWQAIYLGPNLPAEEIAGAVLQDQARAVGLSIIYPGDDPHLAGELFSLRRMLGGKVGILVGGSSAPMYQEALEDIAAVQIANLRGLSVQLAALRTG